MHLKPDVTASVLGGMAEHFSRMWFLFGEKYVEAVALDTITRSRLWAQGIGLRMPEVSPAT